MTIVKSRYFPMRGRVIEVAGMISVCNVHNYINKITVVITLKVMRLKILIMKKL